MIHFFVAGATGRTGRAFVTQATAAGHRVTAYVRDRNRAALPAAALVEGDVLDAQALQAAIAPDHVIISALGGGSPQAPGTALSSGTANLVAAAVARGARRMLAVVGAGVLQADARTLRNELPGYPAFLAAISKEHAAVYRALRESSLDWTLACAPDIVEAPASGRCEASADYLPRGAGRVTTGDIAAFLLDEAITPRFLRTRVGINTV
jgi:putative NADH-flavin reductase